jgi:hypothetical protein
MKARLKVCPLATAGLFLRFGAHLSNLGASLNPMLQLKLRDASAAPSNVPKMPMPAGSAAQASPSGQRPQAVAQDPQSLLAGFRRFAREQFRPGASGELRLPF